MTKKAIGEELPGNSMTKKVAPIRPERSGEKKDRPRKRTNRQIVQAHTRRRGFAESIAGLFFNAVTRNIGQYILNEVIVPTGKTMIEDLVKGSIDMLLYNGESKRSTRDAGTSTVSYGSYYKKKDDRKESSRRYGRPSARLNIEDIYFKRHTDAEDVLTALCEKLEEYEEVSVADYMEMAGIDGATYTDDKWGWTDLEAARITHTRNGYMLLLPQPEELD